MLYRPKPPDEIRRNMSAIRSTENKTESALRSVLHRQGLRFRKYVKALPGNPDIVFGPSRVAVFIDGDYWHGRVLQEKGRLALEQSLKTSNRLFWIEKVERTVERDRRATEALRDAGWLVLRLWESDVKRDIQGSVALIKSAVEQRRQKG
jgi:DNA mismatch endonuclease, patch repair protein